MNKKRLTFILFLLGWLFCLPIERASATIIFEFKQTSSDWFKPTVQLTLDDGYSGKGVSIDFSCKNDYPQLYPCDYSPIEAIGYNISFLGSHPQTGDHPWYLWMHLDWGGMETTPIITFYWNSTFEDITVYSDSTGVRVVAASDNGATDCYHQRCEASGTWDIRHVPEPIGLALFASGLICLLPLRGRRT